MIRIEVMGKQQVKIMKRAADAKHRKFHIDNAKRIRDAANQAREEAFVLMKSLVPEHMHDDVAAEIEVNYNNMLSEAIAEENGKCMEASH